MKHRFLATPNTGSAYRTYNKILAALGSDACRPQGEAFAKVVAQVAPNIASAAFGGDLRYASLSSVFKFLFPSPRCSCCGGALLGNCNFYCSKPCSMLHRTGYSNPSKNPATQRKKQQTWIGKYGVSHPNKHPDVAARISASILGRSDSEKKRQRERIEATLLRKTGFRHRLRHAQVCAFGG